VTAKPRRRIFRSFRIPPFFRPFFLRLSPLTAAGNRTKKLMKTQSVYLLISRTISHRKSCEERVDSLRNPGALACAKACGKAVEKSRISGGSRAEKHLPNPTGRRIVTYCKRE
jgi:hypothetical protein